MDKDGGFAIKAKIALLEEKRRILGNQEYIKHGKKSEHGYDMCMEYGGACRQACKELKDQKLFRVFTTRNIVEENENKALTELQSILQTHIDPGQVRCPAIRASQKSPFRPAICDEVDGGSNVKTFESSSPPRARLRHERDLNIGNHNTIVTNLAKFFPEGDKAG